MQQTCTQCGSAIDTSSRFCTNCGATRTPVQGYRQSWETPPVQNPAQVPPWAQSQGGMYQQQQQQMAGGYNQNAGGSLGFGGSSDAQAKNLMKIAGFVILGAVLLFIVCVALALVVPIPGVRTFFMIIAILLIAIPWIIYRRIRRIMRRTIGGFWRFF